MPTILAVDDSATIRTCLQITFDGTDLDLVVCDNAAAALDKVASLRPALVLVDASLPPTTGYDLAAAIKGSAPLVPVVLLTSKMSPFDPARASVIDEHVEKPFDTQGLYDKVKAVLAGGVSLAPPLPRAEVPADVDLSKTVSFGEPVASPFAVTPPAMPRATRPPPPPVGRTQIGVPRPLAQPVEEVAEVVDVDVDLEAHDAIEFDAPLPEPPPAPVEERTAIAIEPIRRRGMTASWAVPSDLQALRSAVAATVPGLQAPNEAVGTPSASTEAAVEDAPASMDSIRPRAITASWEVPPALAATPDAVAAEPVHVPEHVFEFDALAAEPVPVPEPSFEFDAPVVDEPTFDDPLAFAEPAVEPHPAEFQAAETTVSAFVAAVQAPHPMDPHAASFSEKLRALGLSDAQIEAVVALSRDVVERVAWEVVPTLAETIIKEELRRLTQA